VVAVSLVAPAPCVLENLPDGGFHVTRVNTVEGDPKLDLKQRITGAG
jgi:hypothetical protein